MSFAHFPKGVTLSDFLRGIREANPSAHFAHESYPSDFLRGIRGANPWDERADLYRLSPTHREGPDLDLVVEWCEPGSGVAALDVATGGGHVARRLREAGCSVVSCDPSPGMQPDVICRAEDLPFADGSFDVAVTRLAGHHFQDALAAVAEMARVSRGLVVVGDMLYLSEAVEEAQKLRDPSHVRTYTQAEWRGFFEAAGLEVEAVEVVEKRHHTEEWLARTGCEGDDAERVRALLADRTDGEEWLDENVVLKARKRG